MDRAEMLNTAETILSKAGFHISEKCVARPSCFDFVARRVEQLAFLKVLVNIGSISEGEASELQRISRCFSATPLFVGDQTRNKPLEDDTIYIRYNIYAITPKTFGNVVFLQMHPLVVAGPGGYYVNLDGDAIRKKRQEFGLSVGKLAELMGVCRRTIYGYERGMAKASVSAAYNLEWILGVPVARHIDPLQAIVHEKGFFAKAKHMIVGNRLLQAVVGKLSRFNFKVAQTKWAPFDFVAQFPKENVNIVGGVAFENEKSIDQRAREILSVSEVAKAQPVFVTDGKQVPSNEIPLIRSEDLMKIKCPEDLMARL
jgi:putative transcriptional regulator